jgi:hypothetical protein
VESKWKLGHKQREDDSDEDFYPIWNIHDGDKYGEYIQLYECPKEFAERKTALLNGDLAAACGITREELIRKMVERFYGPRDHPVMDDVLDLLGQLIRGETK